MIAASLWDLLVKCTATCQTRQYFITVFDVIGLLAGSLGWLHSASISAGTSSTELSTIQRHCSAAPSICPNGLHKS
jgi:hypothetical protein